MAKYLLALKDRQEVAKDTMAFWFNTVGTGYTFRAGQNAAFILVDPRKPMARAMRERCLLQLPLIIRVPLW